MHWNLHKFPYNCALEVQQNCHENVAFLYPRKASNYTKWDVWITQCKLVLPRWRILHVTTRRFRPCWVSMNLWKHIKVFFTRFASLVSVAFGYEKQLLMIGSVIVCCIIMIINFISLREVRKICQKLILMSLLKIVVYSVIEIKQLGIYVLSPTR